MENSHRDSAKNKCSTDKANTDEASRRDKNKIIAVIKCCGTVVKEEEELRKSDKQLRRW